MKYLSNIDLTKNQLLNAVIHVAAAAPTTPVQGQVYYNSVDKTLYFYNDTKWVDTAGVDTSTFVLDSDYGAHSILAATVAGAPTSLTVSEQTVVGRVTGGSIAALAISNDLTTTSTNHDTLPSAKAAKAYADTRQAALTFGIADTNTVKIDGTGTAAGQYAKFTANGVIGTATTTVLTDIGAMPIAYLDTTTTLGTSDVKVPTQNAVKAYADTKQSALTFGIGNGNTVNIAAADVASGEYAVFNSTGLESKTAAEVLVDIAAIPSAYLDTDGTLAGNSDTKVATQKAVKTYADALIAANQAMVFKGTVGTGGTLTIAAFNALTTYSTGWTYTVTQAGTLRGNVCETGDTIIAVASRSGSGAADADWTVVQANLDGIVIGPTSATDASIAVFDATTGRLIKDGGATIASLQNQNATHTGDVTGATELTIADGKVTLAKMANLAADSIIGNNTGTPATPIALSGTQVKAMLSLAASDVGLGNVTNDVQTKASIVPNTLPTSGQILVGNSGGTAYAPVALSSDVTMTNTGAVTIADGAVTLAKMANIATATMLGNNTGSTGAPVALTKAQILSLLNVVDGATKNTIYAVTPTDTTTSIVITHSLNTRDIIVQIYEAASPYSRVEVDYELTSVNSITLKFAVAPEASQYRVVITS